MREDRPSQRRRHISIAAIVGMVLLASHSPTFAQTGTPPSPPFNRTTAAPGIFEVKYAGSLLSVRVERADLVELLGKISVSVGVPIEVCPGDFAAVTIGFEGLDLEEAIRRILTAVGDSNLTTAYTKKPGQKKDQYQIDKIVVLRRGAAATPALENIANRDREYREFFEKMDKEGNKIARALKLYSDPKTSNDEKIKLRTYLRQTTVHDPGDKKLLVEASLDPQYKDIQSELHMALLHAIQTKPEEADKEYILHLFENNANLGWQLYGMLKVWDDRYVPYLLRDAREGDVYMIEILGRAKVKQAVPLLEDLLKNSKKKMVRDEAWKALAHITGREYKLEEVPNVVKEKKRW